MTFNINLVPQTWGIAVYNTDFTNETVLTEVPTATAGYTVETKPEINLMSTKCNSVLTNVYPQ